MINPADTSMYYQLSTPLSGPAGANPATKPDPADAMLNMMSSPSFGSIDDNNSFLLDLSPQAQQYLYGLSQGLNGSFNADNILLNAEQQKTISGILAKYKDAPYNQETFVHIQDDLNAAGLNADALAFREKVNAFNPTMVLIEAMSGKSSTSITGAYGDTSSQQTKASNYMKQIISQWQKISTTYQASQEA